MTIYNEEIGNVAWTKLTPKGWVENGELRVWVAVYKIQDNNLVRTAFFKRQEFEDCQMIIMQGKVFSDPLPNHPNVGAFLIFIFNQVNYPEKSRASHYADIYAGLGALVFGKNVQHIKLNVFGLLKQMTSGRTIKLAGSQWKSTGEISGPHLNDETFSEFESIYKMIQEDIEINNSVAMSLTWFAEGCRDNNLLGFIKQWIAIDALVVPVDAKFGKVQYVLEAMGKIYEIDNLGTVESSFLIDSSWQIRNKVVHEGESGIVGIGLIRFMEGIYMDLLRDKVGLKSKKMAEQILDSFGDELRFSMKTNGGDRSDIWYKKSK